MKIGFDAKRLFCNHRGLGNYSRDLVRILATHYPGDEYHLYTPKIKINVPINKNNTTIFQPSGAYKILPSALWRSVGMTKAIKQQADDIYHGLNQEFPVGIEHVNVKKIITFHDAIFIRYPELYDSTYRKIFTAKNQRSCRIADKIIAISQQSANDAIEFFGADPRKTEVIYQGCNNIFRTRSDQEERERIKKKYKLPTGYILFVGAIEPRKNIATILRALAQDKLDIALVIIGRKTEYMAQLETLSRELKVQANVHFLNDVETADLPPIYQMAEIFVYPSIFEGFGIPVLEALCSGTAVITSTGSCFRETGGEHSEYVDPLNADQLGASIYKITTNKTLKDTMISEGLKHAEKFTDNQIATKLHQFYRSIL